VRVQVAHTSDLEPDTLEAARELLYDVFDDMTEPDWEHALGGIHAVAWLDGEVVGHASVVQRRLVHNGRALRTGYVEGVGVREDLRGQGYGGALMDPLERVIRSAYDIGGLGATHEAVPFYGHRGWVHWAGPTYALTPNGVVRTAEDDEGVFVLPVSVLLDLTGSLTCDWRDGDPW
jgi:aminoglycoside 2'-N-acetyltransferase I